MSITFLFPEGRPKALTLSYDDGNEADRRLVDIFNRHHLKATFHLNSALMGTPGRIPAADIRDLYQGHEISCHAATHPFLERLAPGETMREIWNDRLALEDLAGYPVTGMSYPFGTYNAQVIDLARSAGIVYSRTTQATQRFALPDNYLAWHPSCHHRDMLKLAPAFLDTKYAYSVLYVWGHSFEFDRNDNWQDMEQFAELIADRPDIWYVTNIDLYRYDQAVKAIAVSANGRLLHNPSALTVWFRERDTNQIRSIQPGQTLAL